jgi:hypothetical protein
MSPGKIVSLILRLQTGAAYAKKALIECRNVILSRMRLAKASPLTPNVLRANWPLEWLSYSFVKTVDWVSQYGLIWVEVDSDGPTGVAHRGM